MTITTEATTITTSWGFIAAECAAVAEHGPFTDRERTWTDAYANRLCEDAARDFTEHLQSVDEDAYVNTAAGAGGHRAKQEINDDLQLLADWRKAWVKLYAALYAFEGTDAKELSPAAAAYLATEKARFDVVRNHLHEVSLNFLLRKVRASK